MQQNLFNLLGVDRSSASHRERLLSGLGGFLGIFAIFHISRLFLADAAAMLIVASMGASAVLLFAVPGGKLSQPWSLVGGHLLSATLGVAVASVVSDLFLAGAIAVGLAITAMHYARCTHPPGGASALVAVVGGASVDALGFQYVLTPVLLNALVILGVALLFNNLIEGRRYPAPAEATPSALQAEAPIDAPIPKPAAATASAFAQSKVIQEDVDYALRQLGLSLNITPDELRAVQATAVRRADRRALEAERAELETTALGSPT